MLQRFLNKFNVSSKLYFLVFILCSAIIVIAGYGLFQMNRMDRNTQNLYSNRVVCMEQLVNVRHAYAKNIVFAFQELKDGTISYHEAKRRMDAAYTEIDTNWRAYKQTYLTPEESKLVVQAEIMMHQADSGVAAQRALLDKSDTSNFSDLHPVKLFNITYALVEKLNELLKLQVTVSKDIITTGNREYRETVRNFYLLIGFILLMGILLFLAILFDTNHLVENFQTSNKKLSENEERLKTIIDNAGDAIIIFDESLKIILANNYACKLLGYSNEELLTMGSKDILAPSDREKHSAKLEELKTTARSVHERKFLRKDGSTVETETNVQVLKGTGYISIIRDITERKRAQDEIKRRESEFRTLFDNIDSAACLLDTDKKYVIFNQKFINDHKRLTNTEPEVGQVVYDLFPPEVQAERREMIDKVLHSGKGEKIEIDVDYLRDGRRYYYRTAFNPVITDGKVTGVSTISIDLSSIKEAEQKFKDLVEKSLTGVYIYDYEKYVYVNPRFAEITGYSEEELLTIAPLGLVHRDDLEGVVDNLKQRLENKITSFYYTTRLIKKDGTIIWIEVLGTVTVYNGKKAAIGTVLDVTAIKKAALELKQAEEKNRAVVENISDAIFLMDEKTVSFYHSPSVKKIFGYTFEETQGATVFNFIHPDEVEEARKFFGAVASEPGGTFYNQFRALHKNGSYVWIEGTATNLLNDESVKAIILNCRDITERKKAEIEIMELNESLERKVVERTHQLEEANKGLESFSYSVSHDLRAPLRAINGFAQMLEEDYGSTLNNDATRKLGVIRQSAIQMGQLIDDLLAFSKLDRKQVNKSPIDMNSLVDSVVQEINKTTNHKATFKIDVLNAGFGDYNLISQVMVNLLSNAVKYSSAKESPVVEVTSGEKDGEIVYTVKDNGAGFDKRYKDKLFQVFQRLHPADEFEGTGIGLAIVQRIVKKHGGKVWADSELGQGATFSFCLPKQ